MPESSILRDGSIDRVNLSCRAQEERQICPATSTNPATPRPAGRKHTQEILTYWLHPPKPCFSHFKYTSRPVSTRTASLREGKCDEDQVTLLGAIHARSYVACAVHYVCKYVCTTFKSGSPGAKRRDHSMPPSEHTQVMWVPYANTGAMTALFRDKYLSSATGSYPVYIIIPP